MAIRRVTVSLAVLLSWVLWTYAIPNLRIPAVRSLPVPYPILVLLTAAVIVRSLKQLPPLAVRDAVVLLLAPALISVGALLGYFAHAGEASWDATWRLAVLPWVIPVLVLALDRRGTVQAQRGLMIGFLALLAYAAYGFITGRIGDPGEHALGYFGIHYTPSTRNSDAMYFLTLFFILLPPAMADGWVASLWIGFSGLTGVGLVLTQSRGVWLATLTGVLAFIITLRRHRSTRLRMLAVLVVAALTVAAVAYWQGLGTALFRRGAVVMAGDPGGSLQDRIRLVAIGLKSLAAQPLVGIGPGTLRKRIERAGIHLDQGAAGHVENAYLQAWLDAGALGGVGFLLLWLGLLHGSPASELGDDVPLRYAGVKGLTVALTVYLLFNVMFDNLAFWVIVGLVAAHQTHTAEVRE